MKTLNKMRKLDFSKFNPTQNYKHFSMIVNITYDYSNLRWTYSSDTHSVCGVFYGNIDELKTTIREEYNKLKGECSNV